MINLTQKAQSLVLLTKRMFQSLTIIEPSNELLKVFDENVAPLDSKIIVNEIQIRTLDFNPRYPAPPPDLRPTAFARSKPWSGVRHPVALMCIEKPLFYTHQS